MNRGFGSFTHNTTKQIIMHTSAKFMILRDMELFKVLSEQELTRIAQSCTHEKTAKNRSVYTIGSKAEYVYLIEKGSIKSGAYSTEGKTLIKDLYYEGDLFGEHIFNGATARNDFAECMTECRYFRIDADVFRDVVSRNPAFSEQIIQLIISRMNAMEERLQSFVFKKAKTRIAEFIFRTGTRKGIKIGADERLINHGMSHKEIAYLTDTSRQTVARVLNELKKENMIHYGTRKCSKILIRNMQGLEAYEAATA